MSDLKSAPMAHKIPKMDNLKQFEWKFYITIILFSSTRMSSMYVSSGLQSSQSTFGQWFRSLANICFSQLWRNSSYHLCPFKGGICRPMVQRLFVVNLLEIIQEREFFVDWIAVCWTWSKMSVLGKIGILFQWNKLLLCLSACTKKIPKITD